MVALTAFSNGRERLLGFPWCSQLTKSFRICLNVETMSFNSRMTLVGVSHIDAVLIKLVSHSEHTKLY